MKRTIVTLVAAAVVTGFGCAAGATSGQHAEAAPRPAPVQRWTEDSLPPALYLWQKVQGGELVGSRTADRWARAATGRTHRGCYAATGDTTLIMCPDGTIAYS